MSRPASRRAILAGIVAAPVAPTLGATAPDPAEATFQRWLDLVGIGNTASLPDDDPMWVAIFAAEADLLALPPSPTKAAALALNELAYVMDSVEDTIGALMNGEDQDTRFVLRVAQCLRSIAPGRLAALLDDLFADLGRHPRETALWRAYAGEVTS